MFLVYGTISLILVSLAIIYVYIRKPLYGKVLALATIVLVGLAVWWHFSEESREQQAYNYLRVEDIDLSEQHLEAAYGNRYLYQARVRNKSSRYILAAVHLRLKLADEVMEKWAKLLLDPGQQMDVKIYFSASQLARPVAGRPWRVEILAIKARD